MEEQLINAGSVIGKEVLNLEDGTFAGKVQNLLIDEETKCIIGLQLKQKGRLNGKNMAPYSVVKAFGSHAVTINTISNLVTVNGKDIVAMPIVTIDGTVLGRVFDYTFTSTGEIAEYILTDGIIKGALAQKMVLSAEKVKSIGKDVIIAALGVTEDDLLQVDHDVYGKWQEIDDILADLDEENGSEEFADAKEHTTENTAYEERFDEFTNRLNKTIENIAECIREVNTEELADKFKEQADRLNEETKNFLGLMKERLKNSKLADWNLDEFKAKTHKNNAEEDLAAKIVEQLSDMTVAKPLLDAGGNVIVWPGQVIGQAEVKEAIQCGKLQELLDLAVPFSEESEVKIDEEKCAQAGNLTESVESNQEAADNQQ